MENPILDELFFQNFEKKKGPKIVSFRKSKNPQIQKVVFFPENPCYPFKFLELSGDHF